MVAAVLVMSGCNNQPKKADDKATGDTAKSATAEAAPLNALTEEEKTQGWILMFDGTTSQN